MASTSNKRVGLEVSNSAVRLAELTLSGGKVKKLDVSQVRLPARAVVDGSIVDGAAVTAAIERCLKEGNYSVKEVHLGIAGLRAITRELDTPQVPDNELDAAVRLQALDVIPFPQEKTLLSARPLEDVTLPDGTAMRRVLLAAAHRDLVEPLIEAVTAAGLVPATVDLSSTALVRALYDPSVPSTGPEAIVSVGSGLTTIVVHEGGTPHFVRTIAEGGDTITASIAGALDLPLEDAESTKRNLDQTGPHIRAAATAAGEAVGELIAEIRSSVEYYSTMPGRGEVRKVTVTGGGARVSGFVERLQQQLRATVVMGSALARFEPGAHGYGPDEVARRDPLVATVIGLALPDQSGVKALNLLPPEITAARRQARIERGIFAVAAVIIVALVALGVVKYLAVHHAESKVSALQSTVQSLQSQIATKDHQAKAYAAIQTDRGSIVPILQYEVDWPVVFNDLAAATPAGATITSFTGTATPATPLGTPAASTSTPARASTTDPTAAQLENTVIGTVSVNISVSAKTGLAYLETWLQAMTTSTQFRDQTFSSLSQPQRGQVTFSAVIEVLGTIQSGRASAYEVKK